MKTIKTTETEVQIGLIEFAQKLGIDTSLVIKNVFIKEDQPETPITILFKTVQEVDPPQKVRRITKRASKKVSKKVSQRKE